MINEIGLEYHTGSLSNQKKAKEFLLDLLLAEKSFTGNRTKALYYLKLPGVPLHDEEVKVAISKFENIEEFFNLVESVDYAIEKRIKFQ